MVFEDMMHAKVDNHFIYSDLSVEMKKYAESLSLI